MSNMNSYLDEVPKAVEDVRDLTIAVLNADLLVENSYITTTQACQSQIKGWFISLSQADYIRESR